MLSPYMNQRAHSSHAGTHTLIHALGHTHSHTRTIIQQPLRRASEPARFLGFPRALSGAQSRAQNAYTRRQEPCLGAASSLEREHSRNHPHKGGAYQGAHSFCVCVPRDLACNVAEFGLNSHLAVLHIDDDH
jgi:hypothetical protein